MGLNYKMKKLKYKKNYLDMKFHSKTCRSLSMGNTSQQAIYHPEFETREMNLGLKIANEGCSFYVHTVRPLILNPL